MKIWMCYECGKDVSPCPAFDLEDKKYCPADHTWGNKSNYKPVAILPLTEYRLMLAESKAGREYYTWRDHGELSPYKNKASGHFGETIGKLDAWRKQKGRVI